MLVLSQFFSIQMVLGFYKKPISPQTIEKKPLTIISQAVGAPIRIKIPNIRVNAAIQNVGLTSNGAMGIPELPRDTAWYKLGPKPGEIGSAVIAGHLDWLYGAAGAFAHLKVLKPGDIIIVEDDKGQETSFIVRTSRSYRHNEDATHIFNSYDGKSHLNLITCDGIWNRITRTYSKRLVIFADKIEKQ